MSSDSDVNHLVKLKIGGKKEFFDIDDPVFPKKFEKRALISSNYPFDEKLKRDLYEDRLWELHIELAKAHAAMRSRGTRVLAIFEGRDAAGKGGSINAIRQNLNPRWLRVVALQKPTERERGEWYFQRYLEHLPSAGEMVLFDRSWYNRAGVEPVMGFCSKEQTETFLKEVPNLEEMLVREGIILLKFWLNIGQEMQLKRFHDRRHNPLKIWKLSPIDVESLGLWEDYTEARDKMLAATSTKVAPWTIVKANDKRRARLAILQHLLSKLDYDGKDDELIGKPDRRILGEGAELLREM